MIPVHPHQGCDIHPYTMCITTTTTTTIMSCIVIYCIVDFSFICMIMFRYGDRFLPGVGVEKSLPVTVLLSVVAMTRLSKEEKYINKSPCRLPFSSLCGQLMEQRRGTLLHTIRILYALVLPKLFFLI